jgi:methionyl-tRNA formyltransferase
VRVIFYGTPDFAVPALNSLVKHHEVTLVVTRPPRPAGRGMEVRESPVASVAAREGLTILSPEKTRDPEVVERIRAAGADVSVVAAYGQILPQALLDHGVHGALNVHASLLPRWRGASPIAAALLAGDARTGVSIMRMEATLDTGPVLLQKSTAVNEDDTTGSLTPRLARLGAQALIEGLEKLRTGTAVYRPQPDDGVTYAGLVRKSDGDLEWNIDAAAIERSVRAYDPWPGVRVQLGEQRVRLLAGRPLPSWTAQTPAAAPGAILEVTREGIAVMAADRPFLVARVQPPGKQPMAATDYARGRRELREAGSSG